ncbi:hypothetical protein RclHR1_00070051 [Rhizophagus clarus]|nr:hypothetical protein RclHR1_00070051 [Rhizophagus clarus]
MANKIQRSPIFKSHGTQIGTRLREFGEQIREAGHLLQKVYSKGSSVYKSFDIEIKAMIYRLNSNNIRKNDARYFKERLNALIKKIKEFRKLVQQTYNSIQKAENVGNDTENYIFDGLRKVNTFIVNDGDYYDMDDIEETKKELDVINEILNHLRDTCGNLDKMGKILKDYENKLIDIYDELDDRYDGIIEFTREGLESLKFINNLKNRFIIQ